MQGVRAIALGGRLRAALELLPRAGPVADIGAGDARLALALARAGHPGPIYATEWSEGPWRRVVAASARDPRIAALYGDGLAPLAGRSLAAAALLGMGPRTLLGILARHAEFPGTHFVLGPMQGAATLRRGLRGLGLAIREERLARERGRFYPLLLAAAGEDPHPPDPMDDLLGPHLRISRPAGYAEYVRLAIRRLEAALGKSPQGAEEGRLRLLSRLREEYDAAR